jgi:putative tryptophan/tyrosine transport system substrate-binding protein
LACSVVRRLGLWPRGHSSAIGRGGLISYGPNLDDSCGRAAVYVNKILKGISPADLPTKFELVVNLKTARAIAVAVPTSIVAHADEVIE